MGGQSDQPAAFDKRDWLLHDLLHSSLILWADPRCQVEHRHRVSDDHADLRSNHLQPGGYPLRLGLLYQTPILSLQDPFKSNQYNETPF